MWSCLSARARLSIVLALAVAPSACSGGDADKGVDKSPAGSDDKADDKADDAAGEDDTEAPGTGGGKPDAGKPDASTPKPAPGKKDAGSGTTPDAGAGGPTDGPAPSDGGASATGDAGGPSVAESPAVACNPADKKPDPKNVPVSEIRRYQGMTVAPAKGPYKAVLESDPGLPDRTVYRPEVLGEVKHPIVVWANGGCSTDGTYFSKFLLELASYGFVAIADGKPNGSGSRSIGTNGVPQTEALDWIIAENERPCSQYYHKLDVTKTAAAGQSCGGLMSLGASADKRLTTVGIFNSGLFERDQKIYAGLHTPIAYFIGGPDDIAYAQAEADVAAISTVPLFYGNLDVGHFATWAEDNAGEFGRVGVEWFKWQLMGDAASAKVFTGADCELCKPPSKWTIKKKMME